MTRGSKPSVYARYVQLFAHAPIATRSLEASNSTHTTRTVLCTDFAGSPRNIDARLRGGPD